MNAASIAAFASQSAAAGAALWPAVIVLGNATEEVPACVPEPRFEAILISGVEEISGALVARVKLTDLPDKPATQQALRWKRPGETGYRAQVWWIDQVKRSPLDSEWHIVCVPKN